MSLFEVVTQFLTHLVVPPMLIHSVWRGASVNLRRWLANLFVAGTYISYATVAGGWPTFGYPIRYILPIVLIVVAIGSLGRARERPLEGSVLGDMLRFSVAGLFAFMFGWAIQGYRYPWREAADLRFPLHQGIYVVGQGGSAPVLNYHFSVPGQRFAVDVMKLHWFGLAAKGIAPRALEKYAIFGDEVISPCAGRVLAATDGAPDLVPPIERPQSAAGGNSVVLDCGRGLTVVLAHLQRGSVRVRRGDVIDVGAPLARVGNSGNALEPHLHIHARWNDRSIPIRFRNRFLVRNSLIVSKS